ncbi:hypothetical protein BIW11_10392 [Tropilaelaps mercedesae]|uniref:Uncharacterized protein n=1 Tax=Tropilaelaps mercedesae TaxID=418985 RepID=A0A1V9XG74_9ACAR|nr:hypothetical protein BIW11_10392 [Tropilaelaps mercedesae]
MSDETYLLTSTVKHTGLNERAPKVHFPARALPRPPDPACQLPNFTTVVPLRVVAHRRCTSSLSGDLLERQMMASKMGGEEEVYLEEAHYYRFSSRGLKAPSSASSSAEGFIIAPQAFGFTQHTSDLHRPRQTVYRRSESRGERGKRR